MPILQWVNDGDARREAKNVPFHLLERIKTYGTPNESGESENLLVHGDNLIALRGLLPFYRGKVKCIYIDPPYNTGSAFEHYDDNLEHSKWLSIMFSRLQILREFLVNEGSLWVSIDNQESHYLKIILDEIYGRHNFVTEIAWQQRTTRENRKTFSENHESIFVYAKDKDSFAKTRNLLPLTDDIKARYNNPDNDPRGAWQSVSVTAQAGHATPSQFYKITTPSGRVLSPPAGRCWTYTEPRFLELVKDNRIWFGKEGNNSPRIKKFLSEITTTQGGVTPDTLWLSDQVGNNDLAKKHSLALFGNTPFDNPKPESLIKQILTIATNPDDLVLDSFLGSGTTAAVAHKMGRRWIGIEMGEHAKTHCIPRLEKVIAGEQGGISESVHWQGGGSFTFCELADPVFDTWGNINPKVTFDTLSAYLWQKETRTTTVPQKAPFLGAANGVGIYLLYNGILGDKAPASGNVLTRKLMKSLLADYPYEGPKIIYADAVVGITPRELEAAQITFKQIPYDVRG